MSGPKDELERSRERIDALDLDITRLLQERAQQALAAAHAKRELGIPILDVQREEEVLARLEKAKGPLDGGSLKRIYRVVMEETRKAESKG